MKIKKATDINNKVGTYLIYAKPGVGKTTSLKYLPGKKLVIDIDKSSSVLAGEKDIDIVEVDSYNIWTDWLNIVKELISNKGEGYDIIVVDNVSELFRATLANLGRDGKNRRVPEQSHYQQVDFTILDSLRALKSTGKIIVFTAWETTDQWTTEGGQVYNRLMPDMRPKILNNFLGLCDVVGWLMIKEDEDGQERRGFILQPSQLLTAKNRLDDRKACAVENLILNEKGDK